MKGKLIVSIVAIATMILSCSKSETQDQDNPQSNDLKPVCEQMNSNVAALQVVVKALVEKDYVKEFVQNDDKSKGTEVTFANNGKITVYLDENDQASAMSIAKHSDGQYYWKLDNEWLFNEEGKKVLSNSQDGKPASSPKFKIENDYWYVSYDSQKTWEQLSTIQEGKPGANGFAVFADVKNDEDFVTFTLASGTEVPVSKTFEKEIIVSVDEIETSSALFKGTMVLPSDFAQEVYVVYSKDKELKDASTVYVRVDDKDVEGSFSVKVEQLDSKTKYYYTYAIKESADKYSYGEIKDFITKSILVDLSVGGTANCYIVSESGDYKFKPTKGNSTENLADISSVEVLWESFGTDQTPNVGDLISGVSYDKEMVVFSASDKKGNAVIAAKNSDNKIIWSWHIWLTDRPEEQNYLNGAGTFLDRNLGAISTTPKEVGSLGLLYQWGRKDPFLNSSSTTSIAVAKSTTTWKSFTPTKPENGSIAYSIENPTTFMGCSVSHGDWLYHEDQDNPVFDDTRWRSEKTIYDPCPAGYRVPDGGTEGIWSKAFGQSTEFKESGKFDLGYDFGQLSTTVKKITDADKCWYPATGNLKRTNGSISELTTKGYYWSVSVKSGKDVSHFIFRADGGIVSAGTNLRAFGQAVRCVKQ